jgi:hypothetical protein
VTRDPMVTGGARTAALCGGGSGGTTQRQRRRPTALGQPGGGQGDPRERGGERKSTREEPTTVDCGGGNHRRAKRGKHDETTRVRFKGMGASPGFKESVSGVGLDGAAPRLAGDERRPPGQSMAAGELARGARATSGGSAVRPGAVSMRVRGASRATTRAREGEDEQEGRTEGGTTKPRRAQ